MSMTRLQDFSKFKVRGMTCSNGTTFSKHMCPLQNFVVLGTRESIILVHNEVVVEAFWGKYRDNNPANLINKYESSEGQ